MGALAPIDYRQPGARHRCVRGWICTLDGRWERTYTIGKSFVFIPFLLKAISRPCSLGKANDDFRKEMCA